MKTPLKLLLFILLPLAIITAIYWLFTSASVTTLYKGQYKNKTIKVKEISKPGFSRSSISYSIHYGNLKPIHIDAHSIDLRGVPYDVSLFKNTKSIYLDTTYKYKNEIDYDEFNDITFLYISKIKFSMDEYLAYEDLFKINWLRIQNELISNGFSTRIVGLVYGDRKDFIKIFSGTYNEKPYNLTITPDGEINLSMAENSLFLINSGFQSKVQMPGKILLRNKEEIAYSPTYDNFIDEKGLHLKDYFTLK